MPHLGQEKNEWVASLEQEEVLLEQQKGEEVLLLEQENLVPQRISEGKLQKHSSRSPEEWWMKQLEQRSTSAVSTKLKKN